MASGTVHAANLALIVEAPDLRGTFNGILAKNLGGCVADIFVSRAEENLESGFTP